MRGTLLHANNGSRSQRSIPACAGYTDAVPCALSAVRVNPRVCGVHGARNLLLAYVQGQFPRARGTPKFLLQVSQGGGAIPACAGYTYSARIYLIFFGVNPRLRGVHAMPCALTSVSSGQFPLERAIPFLPLSIRSLIGSIPACAGYTLASSRAIIVPEVNPRVCGVHKY